MQIHGTSETGALNLKGGTGAWTGGLDLTTSKLIVESSISNKTADMARLQDQVVFGQSATKGVYTSSTLPAGFAIAVVDNAVENRLTFGGMSVDSNSILVGAELAGDANIDGTVDLSDLSTVLNDFGSTTSNWTSGNFDGAASIDLTDLSDVLNNFGATNPNASDEAAGGGLKAALATPEPASLLVLGVGAAAASIRRRPAMAPGQSRRNERGGGPTDRPPPFLWFDSAAVYLSD